MRLNATSALVVTGITMVVMAAIAVASAEEGHWDLVLLSGSAFAGCIYLLYKGVLFLRNQRGHK